MTSVIPVMLVMPATSVLSVISVTELLTSVAESLTSVVSESVAPVAGD
ncbi:hypothetical protein [Streptomyces sp. Ru73]|nr:hypothetical protein [Streptomyces sp. Ru73]